MKKKTLITLRDTTVYETKTGSLFIEEAQAASVAVVALREDCMILVEQFRHQLEGNTIELPGGGMEPGETPMAGAKRELEEETGIIANHFIHLGTFHPQPYFTNRFSHLFFTTDTDQFRGQNLDEDEQIHVKSLPVTEVLEAIERGHFNDGELGYALLLCRLKGLITS